MAVRLRDVSLTLIVKSSCTKALKFQFANNHCICFYIINKNTLFRKIGYIHVSKILFRLYVRKEPNTILS